MSYVHISVRFCQFVFTSDINNITRLKIATMLEVMYLLTQTKSLHPLDWIS